MAVAGPTERRAASLLHSNSSSCQPGCDVSVCPVNVRLSAAYSAAASPRGFGDAGSIAGPTCG